VKKQQKCINLTFERDDFGAWKVLVDNGIEIDNHVLIMMTRLRDGERFARYYLEDRETSMESIMLLSVYGSIGEVQHAIANMRLSQQRTAYEIISTYLLLRPDYDKLYFKWVLEQGWFLKGLSQMMEVMYSRRRGYPVWLQELVDDLRTGGVYNIDSEFARELANGLEGKYYYFNLR
jgi:hypothetical protein